MNAYVLHPPNSHTLSDEVINVKTRTNQNAIFLAATGTTLSRMDQRRDLHDHALSGQPTAMARCSQAETNTSQGNGIQKKLTVNELSRLEVQDASIARLLVMGKQIGRERRRANQRRYRKKVDGCEKSLEEDSRRLHKEIEQLEQRQCDLRSGMPLQASIWSVSVAYFQVFCKGFGASDALPSREQFDFAQAALSPNVVFNGGSGTEAMLRSWRRLSLSFQNIKIELESLEKESSCSVIATTTTCFTLTEQTLRKIFPHLWNLGTEDVNVALLDKLVGQNIVMRGNTRFEWDAQCGYVTSVTAHADIFTPVLRLVGDLEDVSWIFEKSLISPDFVWKL